MRSREPITIRRLGPGDEPLLTHLAERDADFDVPGRGGPHRPLSEDDAMAYLANPAILHWVAMQGEAVAGFILCVILPMRAGDGRELLLYEIGVHLSSRRRGVGRLLTAEMDGWMRKNNVRWVWVLADNPEAEAFYKACGFVADPTRPVYMTRSVRTRP